MSTSNITPAQVFRDIHCGLVREGPGNQASTAQALRLAQPPPNACRILDIGCGSGAQTIDLARLLPNASVHAVDLNEPYVVATTRRATAAGLADRVLATQGDMRALAFENDSFDLIWCEGAAYIMGVESALKAWRRLLRPAGKIAISELAWLTPNPPEEIQRYWLANYPGMKGIEANRDLVRTCGYELLGDFVLPGAAWQEYYASIEERLQLLAAKYAGDQIAKRVLDDSAQEIAHYRNYGTHYGYVFLVFARTS